MHRCFAPRSRLAAFALALACCAPAWAAPLEQIGTPDASVATMQTYGVDVPVKTALKTLLPAGWQLFVHRSVELPATASWTVGQNWVEALEAFARKNKQSVLLDWGARAVYFRSAEVALEEGARRAQLAQAATTPLPRLQPAASPPADPTPASPMLPGTAAPVPNEPAAAPIVESQPTFVRAQLQPVLANPSPAQPAATPAAGPGPANAMPTTTLVPAPAVSASAPAAPVTNAQSVTPNARRVFQVVPIRIAEAARAASPTQESAAQSAHQASPTAAAARHTPETQLDATPAVPAVQPVALGSMSFNRASVDEVLLHAGRLHGYSVSFEAPPARFPGAVTLLGADMGEELRLAARAMGPGSPVRFELYRDSQVVRILPAAPGVPVLTVATRPFTGVLAARPMTTSGTSAVERLAPSAAAPSVANSTPTPTRALVTPAGEAPGAQSVAAVALPATNVATTVAAPNSGQVPETVSVVAPATASAPVLSLEVRKGESLRDALAAFLKVQGLELKWTPVEDLRASWPVSLQGESVSAVLNALMPKVNLSADIYLPSSLVVVRATDATLDK